MGFVWNPIAHAAEVDSPNLQAGAAKLHAFHRHRTPWSESEASASLTVTTYGQVLRSGVFMSTNKLPARDQQVLDHPCRAYELHR